jgi:hypothetical protein
MGIDPLYRRFYTTQPAIHIYAAGGSTVLHSIVFKQAENDMRNYAYGWSPEYMAPDFRADDGAMTRFPLGVRLFAEMSFVVFAPEFSTEPNQGEGVSFTERDWIWLLKADQLGYDIYYSPHADRPVGTDARFKVLLGECNPMQPDGKTYKADWSLSFSGANVTANPLDEF